jgi:DNA invertase Pin-like site-specific DNA recombinase
MHRTYGYVRVSTDDQDLTLQVNALERYGVDFIFSDKASGKSMKRVGLKRAVKVMRSGDILVVWKLDRLGRNLMGVLEMVESLKEAGIELVSITEQFDTTSPMGKAFMQIAMVFAELERNMISERTKAGMAAGKAAGKRFGRAHSIRDFPKRIALLDELDRADQLRDVDGELLMSAQALADKLNACDPKAPVISNPETVRRWKREGFQWLAASGEPD